MKAHSRFIKQCLKQFSFLIGDYHYKQKKIKRTAQYESILYLGKDAAVECAIEYRDFSIRVYIIKLRDGKIEPYPIFIDQSTELTWFDLTDILFFRAKKQIKEWDDLKKKDTAEYIEFKLKHLARCLRDYASDMLEGKFDLVPKLERRVKMLVQKNNEELIQKYNDIKKK